MSDRRRLTILEAKVQDLEHDRIALAAALNDLVKITETQQRQIKLIQPKQKTTKAKAPKLKVVTDVRL